MPNQTGVEEMHMRQLTWLCSRCGLESRISDIHLEVYRLEDLVIDVTRQGTSEESRVRVLTPM